MHTSLLLPALRRPLIGAFVKPAARTLLSRNFTNTARKQLPPRITPGPSYQQSSKILRQLPSKRFFNSEPVTITVRPSREEKIRKIAYAASIFGGTLFAINFLFNRETREGAIPLYEQAYLKDTFAYTGLGVGMIGVAAKALHNVGWSFKLMTMNPWLVVGVSLAGSIGTMIGCRATHPDNYVQKHALWAGFNLFQAATLAPMFFFAPAILARAGVYTVGMMGSIAYVAATAKEDKYIWLGAPLLAGCAVVALSGLAPLVLPVGSRALAGAEALWLYGGLAVFGGFTLYDIQKVMNHARAAEMGMIPRDPVNESIGLELDFLNIFIRFVYILSGQQNKRR
ncbi:hypothetical protein EX30DRAFT_331831 [Ascodesmis nigricans]|uniref:Bax inhibitor family protein n=1 Tax=Ascodesmis nigricans TaxID=341454 RepID=A0A4S2MVV2_9PEZI|nr:hypothetical protein EX30DRAFT_331831 [Ascodesmis nigricans]